MSIEAVALAAGVSIATVSRVFNTPELVSPPTRDKVQRAARRLHYTANASARTLRTQRSHVIGVVLPTLRNPVFAECLEGIAVTAAKCGYSIIPAMTNYRAADEAAAVAELVGRSVDGVVLVVGDPGASSALKRLRAAKIPYVLAYNRHPLHPCISVDNQAAVSDVVRRLAALGHRRLAMVSGQLSASDRARQRHEGFVRGLALCGLPQGAVIEVPFMEQATGQLTEFLRRAARPTAVFCSNDLLAIRTLRVASEIGMVVPRDLSVVGFDGIELSRDLTPSLSTVSQPSHAMGQDCVRLLDDAIRAGKPLDPKASQTAACLFREGESIAAPLPLTT